MLVSFTGQDPLYLTVINGCVGALRPDSIVVAKERSKGRVATDSGETGAKTTDSVKLQRERSKANLKKEHSTIKE